MMQHQEEAQEVPAYVRLKFFGEGRACAKAPPIRGTFKDVQIRTKTMEELSEAVVQWLGCPGAWCLATVANWPLTLDALRSPTSAQCPLVVHVWNSQEKLAKDLTTLGEKVAEVEPRWHETVEASVPSKGWFDALQRRKEKAYNLSWRKIESRTKPGVFYWENFHTGQRSVDDPRRPVSPSPVRGGMGK
ncbi:unnamed protein product [Durusdinium trenchii]|uniref:Uncharacterized protein n=1 Tax=Durusdinium trenchii TaxID=1381693 RepID=A0ABP0JPX3_9DINO